MNRRHSTRMAAINFIDHLGRLWGALLGNGPAAQWTGVIGGV